MEFARFATTYSITLAAVGAVVSFTVSPFFGVQWTHWLTAGIIQLLALAFATSATFADEAHSAEDACRPCYGAGTVLFAPLTVGILAFVPLTHAHFLLWMLPGIVFLIIWMATLAAAVGLFFGSETWE